MDDLLPKRVFFEPFPKQQEFIDDALSGLYDFVLYGGAIRGGKTYAMLALFILLCRIFPGSRWAIVRKNLPVIERNLYPSWEKIRPVNFFPPKKHNKKLHIATAINGSQIIFFPESFETDKDQDRWKGLEVNGFGFEEINECQQASLEKAFERAGTYIIPNTKVQPAPLVVGTCNPTFGWVKKEVYTPNKEGTLRTNWKYIHSRIYDNIPLLKQQPKLLPFYKATMNRFRYMVFVEGNWDIQLKVGNEFLRGFEINKHVKAGIEYDPDSIIELSIDNNVLPYIAVSWWQLAKTATGWVMRQFHETPAADPDNTPRRAALKVIMKLRELNHQNRIRVFGDRSTKSRNTIDEKKRTFAQIFEETLRDEGYRVENCMLRNAPSVSNMGDFVNAVFDGDVKGIEIEIAEECVTSISDFIETKTDKDGGILKKDKADTPDGPSYQHSGHFTDTLKDFVCAAFYNEFLQLTSSTSIVKPGGISVIDRQGTGNLG